MDFTNFERSNISYITNPSKNIGKNKLVSLATIFAQICQFENPKGHQANGKRAFNITLLSTSSVAEVIRQMENEPSI